MNIFKCKVLSLSRNVNKGYRYYISKNSKFTYLEQKDNFKDHKITVDEKLISFKEHINEKSKAYAMLRIIKRNFKCHNGSSFVLGLLYKSMVRSHLDYCSSVWAPYKSLY